MTPWQQHLDDEYRDLEHQERTAQLGMWLFLATEVMFFGSLFLGLGIYRYQYPFAFEKVSGKLSWEIATANTIVLLLSSYTIVLAVHYSCLGNIRRLGRHRGAGS